MTSNFTKTVQGFNEPGKLDTIYRWRVFHAETGETVASGETVADRIKADRESFAALCEASDAETGIQRSQPGNRAKDPSPFYDAPDGTRYLVHNLFQPRFGFGWYEVSDPRTGEAVVAAHWCKGSKAQGLSPAWIVTSELNGRTERDGNLNRAIRRAIGWGG